MFIFFYKLSQKQHYCAKCSAWEPGLINWPFGLESSTCQRPLSTCSLDHGASRERERVSWKCFVKSRYIDQLLWPGRQKNSMRRVSAWPSRGPKINCFDHVFFFMVSLGTRSTRNYRSHTRPYEHTLRAELFLFPSPSFIHI